MISLKSIIPTLFIFVFITFFCISFFRSSNYKYHLSITALFQNEDRFLKEWIDFHRTVGVEHFYLFNNLSSDDYLRVLKPYIEAGIVELHDWPYASKPGSQSDFVKLQGDVYREGIKLAKGQSKWLAILDTDEFLFPLQKENLIDFLKDYENKSGILVNWQMFGTSNVKRIPNHQFLIETLLQQAPAGINDHTFCKSIFRPECVKTCVDAHTVVYYPWSFSCDPDGYIFPWKFHLSHSPKIDKIRINHYWTRDEDFFYERKISRIENWAGSEDRKKNCLERNTLFNQVFNNDILKFLPALKKTSTHLRGFNDS